MRDVTHSTRERQNHHQRAPRRRRNQKARSRQRERSYHLLIWFLCAALTLPSSSDWAGRGRAGRAGGHAGLHDDSHGTIATYPFCTVKELLPCTSEIIAYSDTTDSDTVQKYLVTVTPFGYSLFSMQLILHIPIGYSDTLVA